jgi:hypothetical protein
LPIRKKHPYADDFVAQRRKSCSSGAIPLAHRLVVVGSRVRSEAEEGGRRHRRGKKDAGKEEVASSRAQGSRATAHRLQRKAGEVASGAGESTATSLERSPPLLDAGARLTAEAKS